MVELMSQNFLATASFMMVLINMFLSIWKAFDRRLLLFINVFLYASALVYISQQDIILWFNRGFILQSGSDIAYFSLTTAITSLFFLNLKSKERIDGFLFVSIFVLLNLSLLFTSNILKIAIILVLFEVVELLVLTNTGRFKEAALKDIALAKLFSIISLSIAIVLILISRDSPDLFEASVLNYDLYHLGVCFFIIYFLSIMYIAPMDEIKGTSLLNSSDFSTICSVLSRFVILGTTLIMVLKRLVLTMEPSAQEGVLAGIKVIMMVAMVLLVLEAMSKKNVEKVSYYLFCMNNILPLVAIYSLGEIDTRLVFFLFALSSFGLFMGIYINRNKRRFRDGGQRGLMFLFYLLGLMALWGAPATTVFEIRYLLVEEMISIDAMIILLAIFMIAMGFLWYPMVVSINEKLKCKVRGEEEEPIAPLEIIGLFLLSAQLIVLNYSNPLARMIGE